MTEPPAAAALKFAARLAARLAGLLGGGLAGACLHGSAVLGGWTASRSDVDMLFVLADDVSLELVDAAGAMLLGAAGLAPGRGLECSAVTMSAAAVPAPPWPFLLHASVQEEFGQPAGQPALVRGRGHQGDPDLLMHYTVARAAGVAVHGPPPAVLIGPVARPLILDYLAGELQWGLAHAPECYAVLNACRALLYLHDGAIVSKLAGGRAALDRGTAPAVLVRRALAQQRGQAPETPPRPDAVRFVRAASSALLAAAAAAAARRPTPPA
jgi:Aminoglycoside adenylyltransferase, C-terminal domain